MTEQPSAVPEQLQPYAFKPGESGNPNGRKPDTPEVKLIRKARKEIIEEYKQALSEALPTIQPVLIAKALEGDVQAIKEIHDRTMDKAKQSTDITSGGKELPQPIINVYSNPSDKQSS
jgi:hypothetical protein